MLDVGVRVALPELVDDKAGLDRGGADLVRSKEVEVDIDRDVPPLLAGDLLEIRASLLKIGNKSITACYVMQNLKTGEVAATLEVIYVLFDVEARSGVPIGDDLRAAAEKHLEDEQ